MRKIMAGCLFGYHKVLSPLLPGACRFFPSCSVYAGEAIQKYGIMRGALLGLCRLRRCHPGSAGGYDPVQ